MRFGLMFFSADAETGDPYALLREAARFADTAGFCAVWVPERHFHPFGGAFPNPAVTAAAVAAWTERIAIRAGSVIAPLHDPIRVVEEWSVVDNLSGGRVGISVGTGWNANDFVFFPDRFAARREYTESFVRDLRGLWRHRRVSRPNGAGRSVEVTLYPPPRQAELPLWLTASSRRETFELAGRLGVNVLTQAAGQSLDGLAEKVGAYRRARAAAGFDAAAGVVTLMLHLLVGPDREEVRQVVREPLTKYLRTSMELEAAAAEGEGKPASLRALQALPGAEHLIDEMLESAYTKYFERAALLGTVADCRRVVAEAERHGVDEIAGLVDFGPSPELVMRSLALLAPLVREQHS